MAITAMQREKWQAGMDLFLTSQAVGAQVLDTNLVQIEGSDTFSIITPTDTTTFTVNDSADITYDLPTDAVTQATKNFDKGFARLKLDTNKMQIPDNQWFEAFARNGAYQLSNDLDTAILGDHANWTDFDEAGTDWQFTKDTAAEIPAFFAQLRNDMRTAQVDSIGMPYVVGPPGFGEAIDLYSATRATPYGDEILLAGGQRAFTYNGFRCFISNNCTTVSTTTHGLAGIMGYGMALGLYNTPSLIEEVGRSEGRYGNLVRGRLAAAYKVYRTASMFDVEFNSTTVAT